MLFSMIFLFYIVYAYVFDINTIIDLHGTADEGRVPTQN
jgi:hypothetical protein